ncbi:MAG: hypothetical protein M1360_04720 [Candidatus Marsarchaeota archaeon]|jgi:hypothetical protein|nr:hypothetical protein [Candidatus Marsarchaeota archaeon]MCL5419208.1 hypothetical protein [Candidatus Marsarchaeota archaeon]
MDTYAELKKRIKLEQISEGMLFAYKIGNNTNIEVSRTAIYMLARDMDRHYETAGFIFGRASSGKVLFDNYVPSNSIHIRGGTFVSSDAAKEENEIAWYRERFGYDSIMFVHSHPNAWPCKSYWPIETLNDADKSAMLEFHAPKGEKHGFRNIYECVLSVTKREGEADLLRLSIFDARKGAESTESMDLIGQAEVKRPRLNDLLRTARMEFQTFRYVLDSTFRSSVLYIDKAIKNAPVGAEYEKQINDMINSMEMPYALIGRIMVISKGGRYLIKVNNPPEIVAAFYQKQLEKIIEEIPKKVELMFPHAVDRID